MIRRFHAKNTLNESNRLNFKHLKNRKELQNLCAREKVHTLLLDEEECREKVQGEVPQLFDKSLQLEGSNGHVHSSSQATLSKESRL